jgi:hypothetical protein
MFSGVCLVVNMLIGECTKSLNVLLMLKFKIHC